MGPIWVLLMQGAWSTCSGWIRRCTTRPFRLVNEPVEVWEVPKGAKKTEEINAQHIEDEYLESGMGKRTIGPRRGGGRRVLCHGSPGR